MSTAKKTTKKSFAKTPAAGKPDPMLEELEADATDVERRAAEHTALVSGDAVPEDHAGPPSSAMLSNSDDIQGDIGDTTIRMPRLNIVQKVGPLADTFGKGEFVLNLEEKIQDGGESLEVTACKVRFYYEENLPYGDDRIPERAETKKEVHERGGILEWGVDGEKPSWHQVAEVLLCIKCPAGLEDSPSFCFTYEGEEDDVANGQYTFALWKLKGSSFNSAGRELLTAKQFYYREGLAQGSFKLTAPLKKFNTGNSAYVATLRKNRAHTPAFREWLKDFSN